MPIDWAAIDEEIAKAEKKTDEVVNVDSKLSSITRMTDEEINALFPSVKDRKELRQLLEIVDQAGRDNTKTAKLADNIKDLSEVALKLLVKFVL